MKTTSFKMTELGPIPSDWEVKRLGEMLSFKNGFNANAKCYGTGTPVASVLDALSNEPITTETIATKVTADDKDRESFSLTKGDLIFTRSSETLEDVGRANVYFDDAPAMFGGFVIRGRFKIQANPIFVNYLLKTSDNRLRVMSQGAGAQHFNIGQSGLENVLIALPPLPEQHRIAAALSDVDELIGALGKLVEKKRAIKTGAMQRLLTGQTRLPGFGGAEFKQTELGSIPSDWEVKRLGEIASVITKGTTPTSVGCEFEQYGINFIKAESISDNGAFLDEMFAHISERTNMFLSRSILKEDDYLFSIAGVLGRVALVPENVLPANTNQALAIIRLDTKFQIDKRYLLFALKSGYIKNRVKAENVAAAQANLSLQDVSSFHIALPTLPEQRAIAAVLSDMDAEIAALEAEQAKYTRIKSGMMQELLTGKTRLR